MPFFCRHVSLYKIHLLNKTNCFVIREISNQLEAQNILILPLITLLMMSFYRSSAYHVPRCFTWCISRATLFHVVYITCHAVSRGVYHVPRCFTWCISRATLFHVVYITCHAVSRGVYHVPRCFTWCISRATLFHVVYITCHAVSRGVYHVPRCFTWCVFNYVFYQNTVHLKCYTTSNNFYRNYIFKVMAK